MNQSPQAVRQKVYTPAENLAYQFKRPIIQVEPGHVLASGYDSGSVLVYSNRVLFVREIGNKSLIVDSPLNDEIVCEHHPVLRFSGILAGSRCVMKSQIVHVVSASKVEFMQVLQKHLSKGEQSLLFLLGFFHNP